MISYLLYNAAIDGYLIWAAGRLAGRSPRLWRALLGTAVGALGGLWPSPAARFGLPPLMLLIAFGPDPGRLSKLLGAFFGMAFLLAGLGFGFLAVLGFRASPGLSALGLLPALPISAVLMLRHLGRRTAVWAERHVPLRVRVGEREVATLAFADSGNQLRDPWTHWPVVVAEHRTLRSLWSPEVARIFASGNAAAASELAGDPEWSRRFCLVPFRSLGAGTRFLLGFRPDGVILGDGESAVHRREVVIGVSTDSLSPHGGFGALMPAGLLTVAS